MPDVIDNVKVGEYIKSLLKERNMTQSDLAKELNITKSAVSQNLNGKSTFDIQNLMRIAELFDVSIDMMLNMKSDEDRDVISEYERLVRRGYDEISGVATEQLNIAIPDLYGKVFVEYVMEYDKRDIFEFLIHHNIKLYEPTQSNARNVRLKIMFYMIRYGMNGFVSFLFDYVRFYGSFQIPNEPLEKAIIDGLEAYPDKDTVKNLFATEVKQEVPFLKYFNRTKKFKILSGKDWSKVIAKYHAKTMLTHLLNTNDVLAYIDGLFHYFIQYGFFDGVNLVLLALSEDDIERIRKKHSLAQDLIELVSETNRLDLFQKMVFMRLYNNLTTLTVGLIAKNIRNLYDYLLTKHPEKLDFRIVGKYMANHNHLRLLESIQAHLTQDDLDYILSTTASDHLDCNLLLLHMGARMNTTYLNKDTTDKMNRLLSHFIEQGDE